jgi:hypothetical protein
VPFDVAWALGPADFLAYYVAMGELNGGEYDWGRMRWKDP